MDDIVKLAARLRTVSLRNHIVLGDQAAEAIEAQAATITALRAALSEALDSWEDAANYKGDHLRAKHGDVADIARLRALLEPSTTESRE